MAEIKRDKILNELLQLGEYSLLKNYGALKTIEDLNKCTENGFGQVHSVEGITGTTFAFEVRNFGRLVHQRIYKIDGAIFCMRYCDTSNDKWSNLLPIKV